MEENIDNRRQLWTALLAFGFLAIANVAAWAAPQAELWPRWEAHNSGSTETLDHSAWAAFLESYLVTGQHSGVNLVRYGEVSPRNRERLDNYIAQLESTEVSDLNRNEQMAYWLNMYNAVTVRLILDHYPVESIRDIKISGPVFNRHPWDAKLVTVEGEDLSLNDIEHRIIRPIWQDARIHYAVNCAAMGCPNLKPEPFTGENYSDQFEVAAREFINHPRGARIERDRLHASSIFTWYEDDFRLPQSAEGDIAGVVAHMLEYAEPELAEQLRRYQAANYRPRPRYDYDWSLNEP
ncbi:MAG: DUF547 domain-containing protein [Spirochaetaceae bacterium]|nr:MAG: DUF547 domain-containing protein [Spirochaetaceae bacterium]